jgi:hypothetical protein
MKKLLVAVLLGFTLFTFSTLGTVSSEAAQPTVEEQVLQTNTKIDILILEAQLEADLVLLDDSMTDQEKDEAINEVIFKLVIQTEKLSSRTIQKAARQNVVVYCFYKEVVIGGKTVLIDPLRVGEL